MEERDAAAARVLAGASFSAMREDFTDLRDQVDKGFMGMRCKFDLAAAGPERIVELIESLRDERR